MGLNENGDYFCKDTELQIHTNTGVKRIINPFIFQIIFNFYPCVFAFNRQVFSEIIISKCGHF